MNLILTSSNHPHLQIQTNWVNLEMQAGVEQHCARVQDSSIYTLTHATTVSASGMNGNWRRSLQS